MPDYRVKSSRYMNQGHSGDTQRRALVAKKDLGPLRASLPRGQDPAPAVTVSFCSPGGTEPKSAPG